MPRSNKKIHIIGAGFSGLMAAYFLKKKNHEVLISESHQIGGAIRTVQTPFGIAEEAASSFLWTPLLGEICSELQIELTALSRASRKRYVAHATPILVSPLAAGPALLRYLWHRVRGRHVPHQNESLTEWGHRTLGSGFTEKILLPATLGVWGLTADRLSASLILSPFLFRDKNRSKRGGSVAPLAGMGTFTHALSNRLQAMGVQFQQANCEDRPDADAVILAMNWRQKLNWLQKLSPSTASVYSKMTGGSITTTTVFHEKTEQSHPYPGFGILFHPSFQWSHSGVLFNDQIFQGRGPHQSETWISDDKAPLLPEGVLETIRADRDRLGLKGRFLGFHQKKWQNFLPQYTISHEQLLRELASHQEDLASQKIYLVGNELGEIGLASLAEKADRLAQSIGNKT